MNPNQKLSIKPIHNIKSVSEKTGVPSVTLRAWERRYGFPNPERTDSGYRLYSEYDISALNWLKLQTENGLSIGQAVKLLENLLSNGHAPFQGQPNSDMGSPRHESIEQFQPALVQALINLDEQKAYQTIQTAMNLYPLEAVLLEVIQPTMIEIGERWHDGEISVATEHFATQHCRMHLITTLDASKDMGTKGRIITACAPDEWHELGALMITVMLRWRGWNVTYLGANLSLERFSEAVNKIKPQLILFSASKPESALNLTSLTDVLAELTDPKPLIGLGGQAFLQNPTLINQIPGTFMGPNADTAIQQIELMLSNM